MTMTVIILRTSVVKRTHTHNMELQIIYKVMIEKINQKKMETEM